MKKSLFKNIYKLSSKDISSSPMTYPYYSKEQLRRMKNEHIIDRLNGIEKKKCRVGANIEELKKEAEELKNEMKNREYEIKTMENLDRNYHINLIKKSYKEALDMICDERKITKIVKEKAKTFLKREITQSELILYIHIDYCLKNNSKIDFRIISPDNINSINLLWQEKHLTLRLDHKFTVTRHFYDFMQDILYEVFVEDKVMDIT